LPADSVPVHIESERVTFHDAMPLIGSTSCESMRPEKSN
jgi:hypothetical protein